METALRRLADELTAVFAGLLGYVAALAVLGIGVIQILKMDAVGTAIEALPQSALAAVERPFVVDDAAPARDGSE